LSRVEHLADGVTLYLGDCREILPTLGKFDAVVTDPPYGVGLVKKTNDFRGSKHFDDGESTKASKSYDDDPEIISRLVVEAAEIYLPLASRALVFPGNRMAWRYPEPKSSGTVYVPNGAGRDPWGFGCHNMVLFYGKDPYLSTGKGSYPNSATFNQPNREAIDHPCPKPVEWMLWAVKRASLSGESVLDPFMGSGTTGVACVKLGRKFTGIEIDPSYLDIACRRISAALKEPDLFIAPPKPAEQLSILDGDAA
jgi:DNA modification methylase